MKLLKYFTLACILIASSSFAQTKIIAFKSHSGNMLNFSKALSLPKMDVTVHNLGMAPNPIIETAELDSVIFISDSVAVMITSNYCQENDWYYRADTASRDREPKSWGAGSDTVINHPLFSQQHSLDSIKDQVQHHYFFVNGAENTVFVGYDNKKKKKNKKQEVYPLVEDPSQPNGGLFFMISAIICIALFIGFASWMLAKKRTVLPV